MDGEMNMNTRMGSYKMRRIGVVLFAVMFACLCQPAAYALTPVGHVITGPASSGYGDTVQFTSVITDASSGGSSPTGSVTFHDGATQIGSVQALAASQPTVVYKNGALAPSQAGLKLTCGTNCPVIQWGGLTYWAYDDTNNNYFVYLYAYDANNSLVKSWQISGNRYVSSITVDNAAQTVALNGQSSTTTRTWAQLENFHASASLSISNLNAGVHMITAAYSGDGTHAAQLSSAAVQHTVSKVPVTVQLNYSPQTGESIYGHPVRVTVQVTNAGSGGSVPTGKVALSGTGGFSNWPSELNLTNGTAAWETDQLGIATHTVTAHYLGDDSHLSGTSASRSVQIKRIPVEVEVTASVTDAVYYGTPITFTARVTNVNGEPQLPTGSVVFSGGNLSAEPVSLDAAGYAALETAALLPGTYTIQAAYVPDSLHEAQTSDAVTQVVTPNNQGTALVLNHPSGVFQLGEPILFSASVGGIIGDLTVTGHFSLRENGTEVARVTTDVYGNAEISLAGISSGTHRYTALYEREGMTNGTESPEVVVVVQPALTQLILANNHFGKALPTDKAWISVVAHGDSPSFTLTPVSAEGAPGASVQVKRMDPISGETSEGIESGAPVQLAEGLNRFWIQVRSADGTASTEHVVSILYQQTKWDISSVLSLAPSRFDMDGNHSFDKMDVVELLKLIEPITVEMISTAEQIQPF